MSKSEKDTLENNVAPETPETPETPEAPETLQKMLLKLRQKITRKTGMVPAK